MQFMLRHKVALLTLLTITWVDLTQAAPSAIDERYATHVQRHMACLQHALPTALDASAGGSGEARLLRALLVFKAGEATPSIEWLWKADEGAATQLEAHLSRYRMPCLQSSQAAQAVVQELWFSPGTGHLEAGDVSPTLVPGAATASCYEPPKSRMETPRVDQLSKALVFFRFPDDGGEPEVEVAHRVGAKAFAEAARRHVSRYTRCSEGRTGDGWHAQFFSLWPDAAPPARKPLDLPTFLGLLKGKARLRAHFDLTTMQCPFTVQYMIKQPVARNSARAPGESDANRSAFLAWMSDQQLDLPAAAETDLFGEPLTINVPCMRLNLAPGQ